MSRTLSPQENTEGLIHAWLLDGTGGGRRLTWEELAAWKPEQGVLWVHLDYSHEQAQQWILHRSGLAAWITEALLSQETRPRATAVGEGLVVSLRGVNLNAGAEPSDMVAIRLSVDRNRIISTRKRVLHSVQDVVAQLERGRGPVGAGQFLVTLTDRLVRRMSDTVEEFEDRVGKLEEQAVVGAEGGLRYELATLRRQIIGLRRYLAPQREALAQLGTEKCAWLGEIDRLRLREVGDRLVRLLEDLDAVRERAAVTQEELLSRLSEKLNARMYLLSLVAAVFLPLGFLTGLLGINVGGIPGAENSHAFEIFLGILAFIILGQMLLFRWKKWL